MRDFAADAGVKMARVREIVSEHAFEGLRGKVRALYHDKVFGAGEQQAAKPAQKPQAPMGT